MTTGTPNPHDEAAPAEDFSDLLGIHGKTTLGPRWQEFRHLNNSAARLLNEGKRSQATAAFEAAYRQTLVDDIDTPGMDARARVLGNLASLAEDRGEIAESLRLAGEAIAACLVVEHAVGDHYGTMAVRASVLINRAQTHQRAGRVKNTLADLAEAAAILSGCEDADSRFLTFTLHNTRTVALYYMGRWEEAEAEAQTTLDIALATDPRLAGHPYSNLATIAQATGDLAAAKEYLSLAQESHAMLANHSHSALTVSNQGRLALRSGDLDQAMALFAQAEQAFEAGGEPLRVAEVKYGRAMVAFNLGDLAEAGSLLASAIEVLQPAGVSDSLAECLAMHGDLLAAEGRFDEAEAAYLSTRELYATIGTRFELARVDVRRVIAMSVRSMTIASPAEQAQLVQQALDLALPAALATDAVRHRFTPGSVRERWVTMVSNPAMAVTFGLIAAAGDSELAAELIENVCATVSLRPDKTVAPAHSGMAQAAQVLAPGNGGRLASPFADETGPTDGDLPFAASTMFVHTVPSAEFPAPRFSLPPRLRVNPHAPALLDRWIDIAEQRYGFAVRSRQVVDAW